VVRTILYLQVMLIRVFYVDIDMLGVMGIKRTNIP